MKVLYDSQCFTMQSMGGISRYFSFLIKEIPHISNWRTEVSMIYNRNAYLSLRSISQNWIVRKMIKKHNRYERWNFRYSMHRVSKHEYDVFHPTYYDCGFLSVIGDKPFVLTVHDMNHEIYPEFFTDAKEITERKRKLCHAATRIIAISESTKRDLIRILGIEESKIDVVYHGLMMLDGTPSDKPLYENYILYVGDRYNQYKNFRFFVESIAPLLRETGVNLVCSGGGRFTSDEREFFLKLGVDKFCFQRTASENELMTLYHCARCFVFPSLYEGFGLPLLEAFSLECPVLCSNSSCFPEIAGDAAIYFDPFDGDDIYKAVSVFLSGDTANEKRMKGKKQLKKFSIQNTLGNTLAVYERAIQMQE